jgi:hypothetical protein
MLTSVLVATTVEEISSDLLHLEHDMDFVRNRQFRQTLLCEHRRVVRALNAMFMNGLSLSSRAVTQPSRPDFCVAVLEVFQNGPQRAEVTLPTSRASSDGDGHVAAKAPHRRGTQ